jgi:hypothetical protein
VIIISPSAKVAGRAGRKDVDPVQWDWVTETRPRWLAMPTLLIVVTQSDGAAHRVPNRSRTTGKPGDMFSGSSAKATT